MRLATHLAARALMADRLDHIQDSRLDAIHAAWCTEAPQPTMTEGERRHMADRRAVARMRESGRRTGDHGKATLQMADWLELAEAC